MINLKHEVQKRGFTVAHIKTDSIKIPDATPEIIHFVTEYGKEYGYNFEHEATYDRMCLVNDAVYIAKYATMEHCKNLYGETYISQNNDILKDCKKHGGEWTPTGTQFQIPYVFKTLFSKEDIVFDDMCETKSVTSSLYLDMNENMPNVQGLEKQLEKIISDKKKNGINVDVSGNSGNMEVDTLVNRISHGHNYIFVGKVGRFCPIKEGCGGGLLMREKDGKYYAVTGTKGYRWLEAELVKELNREKDINVKYYGKIVDDAVKAISEYGNVDAFISDEAHTQKNIIPPWLPPCGDKKIKTCLDCKHYKETNQKSYCDLKYDISKIIKEK